MDSKRHAIITSPNYNQPFIIHSVNGEIQYEGAGYVFDPTEHLGSTVVINPMVINGYPLTALIIDKTEELPLGFHFHVLVLGHQNSYINVAFKDGTGKFHYTNELEDRYSERGILYYNMLTRFTLISSRDNQRREWFGTDLFIGDNCTGTVE